MPMRRRTVGRVIWGAAVAIPVAVAALGVAALAAGAPNQNPYSWSQFSLGASGVAVGGFVAWRKPRHPLGWLLILSGAAAWCSFAAVPGLGWLFHYHPEQERLARALLHIGISGWIVSQGVMIAHVPLAFPDGFLPTWWRRSLLVGATFTVGAWALAHSVLWTPEYFQGRPATGFRHAMERLEPTFTKAAVVVAVIAMASMLWSTFRAEQAERRRQAGFAVAVVGLLLPTVLDLAQDIVHVLPQRFDDWNTTVQVWMLAVAPVVLAVGVLRHGLLGIEVIVRKATAYAAIVVAGAAIYLGTVWVVATVRPGSDTVPAVIGAGVLALTLGLVRERVNRWLSRRMFGSRHDPYEVIREVGARIDTAPLDEQGLQTVTDTICHELRLPFARAELQLEDARVEVARSGSDGDATTAERFPLAHRGVMLGELVVGRRTPAEPLTTGERDLIATLAGQAGVLAHNLTLVEALRRSRVTLLNAREEERRRIRADLHDGLGPTLATVALGIEAGANSLKDEPELAALLHDLEQELHTAIADVRSLVHNLRPAALDDLGLVSAVREYASSMAARSAATDQPLEVVVDAPTDLGELPAAVEVAAYRVALEALTNVARHSNASSCAIRVRSDHGLDLEVEDNGIGIGEHNGTGIGLRSMRERVTELGGRFTLGGGPGGGTSVHAWFPIADPVPA